MAPTTNSRQPQRLASSAASATTAGPNPKSRSETTSGTECPDCVDGELLTEDGVTYCSGCGVVVEDSPIEHSEPQWRDYKNRRLGPKQSQQWVNTGTTITRSVHGDTDRLSRYNERLQSDERSLVSGLRELRDVAAAVELSQPIRERAAYWYRKTVQNGLLKGRSIEGFAAACVFLSARERRHPMTLSRLAPYSPLSESKIRNHVSILRIEFEPSIPPARPQDFLPRVVSELEFDPDVEHRAGGYLTRATDEELHIGKHPAAIAATAVYAAATDLDLPVNQQAVAEAADVSAVTISRHYQDIRELSPPESSL